MAKSKRIATPVLTAPAALQTIREWAKDSRRIVTRIKHSRARMEERRITRRQVELCLQKGTITEGPFMNEFGNWQVNMYRHAAGEEVTCTVVIDDQAKQLLIRTVMPPKGRKNR